MPSVVPSFFCTRTIQRLIFYSICLNQFGLHFHRIIEADTVVLEKNEIFVFFRRKKCFLMTKTNVIS